MDLNLLLNDIVILLSVLLYDTDLIDLLDIGLRATIQDRHLAAIDLDEAVVDIHAVECRQSVLYGAAFGIALGQDGTTCHVHYIFCDGLYDRLPLEVNTLDAIACIFRCRIKSSRYLLSRMKSLTKEGETTFERFLLRHVVIAFV